MTLTDDLVVGVRPCVRGGLPGPRSAELLARQESNARMYGRHLPIAVEAEATTTAAHRIRCTHPADIAGQSGVRQRVVNT
jgi:hypothetical protein